MLSRIVKFFSEIQWKYILFHSRVRVSKDSSVNIGAGVNMLHSNIYVGNNSTLTIKEGVTLKGVCIYLNDATLIIDKYTSLIHGENAQAIYNVDHGEVLIGHHSRLMCKRLWVRFGGTVRIGNYTTINHGSEIRADASIKIGSYNQISYNVNIWDTNTHCQYSAERRRNITEQHWPYYGFEFECPKTAPVVIGDDCWLGEQSTILKGTTLGDCVTVGYRTTIAGKNIAPNSTVIQKLEYKIISNS